jgi:hypothetical protein
MEDDPEGAFLQTPHGVLHVEDIRAYIHCKLEIIGSTASKHVQFVSTMK